MVEKAKTEGAAPVNTLAARIAKASQQVGALATDKHNKQGEYDYISADKILDRAGGALADNGLALIPSITGLEAGTGQTRGGSTFYTATVKFEMHLTDGTSEAYYPWAGMGVDYTAADKAMYKAITSGHKYFIMKLLNVGVGNEDGEHEEAPPEEKAKATVKATGKATAPSNGKAATKPAPAPAPEPAVAPPSNGDLWKTWGSPQDAQTWAYKAGACADMGVALGSWQKSVKALYPDKKWLGKEELPKCYEHFYNHQVDKLKARQTTVAQADEMSPDGPFREE
jgi:hypothetical protein